MKTRKTKQKQLIIDILMKSKTHLSILELYEKVLKADPTIGQATVYRNVNKLVEEGILVKISMINDVDRYDANTNLHDHFVCKSCEEVIDIFDKEKADVIKKIEKKYHFTITNSNIIFEGYCEKCKDKMIDND